MRAASLEVARQPPLGRAHFSGASTRFHNVLEENDLEAGELEDAVAILTSLSIASDGNNEMQSTAPLSSILGVGGHSGTMAPLHR